MIPGALVLPPARQGDVSRAVSLLRPRAIGIVDGYFQWTPAVWHKEILWAIHGGVYVFGASSIGALRAAELAPFGMRGVGRVFEAYRDGRLAGDEDVFEDDDEVAVVHGPQESGYAAGSEAMVNIRCTLAAAVQAGVISGDTHRALVAIAKAMFFPDRTYPAVVRRARSQGLAAADVDAFERWLPGGRVNQKRLDAVMMVAEMRDFLASDPPPARAGFTFENTTLWARASGEALVGALHDPRAAAILAEVRLDAPRYDQLRNEAVRMLLSASPSVQSAESDDAGRLARAAKAAAEERLRAEIPAGLVERRVLSILREGGAAQRLLDRAQDKDRVLAAVAPLPAMDAFSGPQLLELEDWYFTEIAGREIPDDLAGWLEDFGYADIGAFHHAIFAEWVYRDAVPEARNAVR